MTVSRKAGPGNFLCRLALALTISITLVPHALAVSEAELETLLSAKRVDTAMLKSYGADAIPPLISLYKKSDEDKRARIAWAFYVLSIKSPEVKEVLMQDVQTNHRNLRLQVQWALGRVSDDSEVVSTLLSNMQNDPNPLFRDKAACALASDQVHLTPVKKVQLYEGLIDALEDPKGQVRNIAIKALKIQTGQTKGYRSHASPSDRETAIKRWRAWLAEYKRNL